MEDVFVVPGAIYSKIIDISNPQEWGGTFPHGFALPTAECLNAIGKGDTVTIEAFLPKGFRSTKDLTKRVSFEVLEVSSNSIKGVMKVPADWPPSDSEVVTDIPKSAVMDVKFADPKYEHLTLLVRDKYTDWCLLDTCGMSLKMLGTYLVEARYIYRDEPKILDDNKDRPDSGWRISHRPHALSVRLKTS